jgi:hypothetical protein
MLMAIIGVPAAPGLIIRGGEMLLAWTPEHGVSNSTKSLQKK